MSCMADVALKLKEDGNRSWNYYIAGAIGLKPAMVFSSLVLKAKYYEEHQMLDSDGWFYCTIEDLYDSTMFKYKSQAAAIKKLIALGLIEFKTEGLFNKRFFRIVAERIDDILDKGKSILKNIGDEVKECIEQIKEELCSKAEKTEDLQEKPSNVANELSYKIDRRTLRQQLDSMCPCDDSDDGYFVKKCLDSVAKILIKGKVNRQRANIYSMIDTLNRAHKEEGLYQFFLKLSYEWTDKVNLPNIHYMNAYFDTFVYNYIDSYDVRKLKGKNTDSGAYSPDELDKWLMREYTD